MRYTIKLLGIAVFITAMGLSFAACKQEPTDEFFMVYFKDGDKTVWEISIYNGEKADQPRGITKAGYILDGWCEDDKIFAKKWDFDKKITKEITLYAKWVPIYTVTFNSMGGSSVTQQDFDSRKEHMDRKVTEPENPARTGYIFDGWYTDPNTFLIKWIFKNKDNEIIGDIVTGNITLYAKWILGFAVTFNSNGGSSVPSQTLDKSKPDELKISEPVNVSKIDHVFEGWYTDNNLFTDKWDFRERIVTENVTLYAKWSSVHYFSVTFNSNGGSSVPAQNLVMNSTSKATEPQGVTRTGYIFDGWYTDNTAFTIKWNFDDNVTGNITLFAKWVPVYTVTFNSNGGSSVTPQNFDSRNNPEDLRITEPNVTRTGYIIEGWYTDNNSFTYKWYFEEDSITESIILYAKWIRIYTVIFECNGGYPVETQIKKENEKATEPQEVTRTGDYSFMGWFIDSALTRPFDFSSVITGNIVLYAKWISPIDELLMSSPGGTTASNLIYLPINMQLNEADWRSILSAVAAANKFIELDLSFCMPSGSNSGGGLRSDGTFDPLAIQTGKNRIVSLILPDKATNLAGTPVEPAFRYFSELKTIKGEITSINAGAFSGCTKLSEVDLKKVTNVGDQAFSGCTMVNNINFPVATNIGYRAFFGCTQLDTITLPEVTSIGIAAFSRCTNLTAIKLAKVTGIGDNAFSGCIKLTNAELPEAIVIGAAAFSDCILLENISLPEATSIGSMAFFGCTGLNSISLHKVTNIGDYVFDQAFGYPQTQVSITMGSVAPTLGLLIFRNVGSNNSVRNITVLIPQGAHGYGESPENISENIWGNAFRGKGWDGINCLSGTVNENIRLTITEYIEELLR